MYCPAPELFYYICAIISGIFFFDKWICMGKFVVYLTCLCQSFCCSCKKFLLYAKDESILKVVNFKFNMAPVNFYHFQNVKGLLVKCSEAGNVAARHLLGKVA